MAKRSNKIFRVQPMAGAAANLADVPHEGMCRGAAANAKEGCEQLAKKTAIINSNMNNKSPARQSPFTPLRTCVFKASAGQKNDVGENKKRPRNNYAPKPSGSFFRPGLAIPCWVARQQSPTPFHQAITMYTKKKRSQTLRARNVRPVPETKAAK